MVEDADAPVAVNRVTFEREVHFLDPVPLGAGAECRLGARRPAAEQDGVVSVHVSGLPRVRS
jgi:hypothetical protein